MLGHADRLGRNPGVNSWNAIHTSQGCGLEQLAPTGGAGLDLLLRDQLKRVIQGIASEIAKELNPESVPSPFKLRLNCSGGL
jgi:hypothetical protein